MTLRRALGVAAAIAIAPAIPACKRDEPQIVADDGGRRAAPSDESPNPIRIVGQGDCDAWTELYKRLGEKLARDELAKCTAPFDDKTLRMLTEAGSEAIAKSCKTQIGKGTYAESDARAMSAARGWSDVASLDLHRSAFLDAMKQALGGLHTGFAAMCAPPPRPSR